MNERERIEAAEAAAIAAIPADLMAWLATAQAAFTARGGCLGCGSQVLAAHECDCPTLKNDLY